MDVDLKTLASHIFSSSPKEPKSIQLQFLEHMSNKDLFEFLLELFTEGSKIKYGIHQEDKIIVDLNSWTDTELDNLKDYFKSISFKLIVDIYHINDTLNINFDEINYRKKKLTNNNHLREYKLPLNVGNNIFVINFDYL
jgi:hypothetical protein